MFASHVNTAGTLAWTLLHSAKNKNLQQRIHKATDDFLQAFPQPNYAALSTLKYFDLILKESIRRYSALLIAPRVATQDYQIPGQNLTVKKGQLISPFPGFIQEHFTDLDEFDPDRWERKEAENIQSFYHFGTGPHACLGRAFATLIVKTMLLAMYSDYNVDLQGDVPPPDLKKAMGLNIPEGNPVLTFNKRDKKVC